MTYERPRYPWHHFANGRHYGYPLCCVIRYSLGAWRGNQAVRRGRVVRSATSCFVPCRIFHKGVPF